MTNAQEMRLLDIKKKSLIKGFECIPKIKNLQCDCGICCPSISALLLMSRVTLPRILIEVI
jgi:hypothetical protein